MIVTPGATSKSISLQIVDDTGLAVTGLVAGTFPTTSYERVAEALAAISLSDLAALTSAYSSGGVKEVGGGYYRLDVPDAAFATASTIRVIGEATGKHILYPPITCAKLAATLGSADYTGDTPQTGDAYARIGVAGVGLTNLGDARIANLDTTVSSRSTFAGGAVASVTGAVGSVTGNVGGNVTGSVGSVSGAVGSVTGAVGSVTSAVSTNPNAVENAIKAKTDNLPSTPAAVGSVMSLDLTQAIPTTNTAQTIGDALNAARAQGFGRWKLVGNTLSLYGADGTTVVKTLTFDDTVNPGERK